MKKVKHSKVEVCSKFKDSFFLKDLVARHNINKKEKFVSKKEEGKVYHVQQTVVVVLEL